MRIIRIFTVSFAFFVYGFGALVISFILYPLGFLFVKAENRKKYFVNIIHKSWDFFTKLMIALRIMDVKIENYDEFKKLRGKIIVANHHTLTDIVILIGAIPNSVSVVKGDFDTNIFVKNIVKNAYLSNSADIDKFKASAAEFLKDGFNIIIFPTGTRTLPGEKPKIHSGAAVLAIENNADIIPIKIKINYPFLAKNTSIINAAGDRPVKYNLKICDTIKPQDILSIEPDAIKARKLIADKVKQSCFD